MHTNILKGLFYSVTALFLSVFLYGCGDENFFKNLADDDSEQAKIEAGIIALDKGECLSALNSFTEAYGSNSATVVQDVSARMNLAGARLCQSGFSATSFIDVAADFGNTSDATVTTTNLFNKVADLSITSLDPDWQTYIAEAKDLLDTDPTESPIRAFNNNEPAGFNLSITLLVEAVLVTVDVLNFVDGIIACGASQGSGDFTNCTFSQANIDSIVNALNSSESALAGLAASEVKKSVSDLVAKIDGKKGTDGDSSSVSCIDFREYLFDQDIIASRSDVTC